MIRKTINYTKQTLLLKRKYTTASKVSSYKLMLTKLQDDLHSQSKTGIDVDWKTIRSTMIKQKYTSEINVDAIILGLCNSNNSLDLAKSYIEFLRKEGFNLNYAVIGRLMKVFYLANKNAELSKEDKAQVVEIYDNMRNQNTLLDAVNCENLIYGLITTDRWKESLDLLEMAKLTAAPNAGAYSIVIAKAFENECNHKLGWNLLAEMVANGRVPQCAIYINYFNSIKKDLGTFYGNLEKMLLFLGNNAIIVSDVVVQELQTILNGLKYNARITNISKNGKCCICNLHLKDVRVTNEEYSQLTSCFMKKVLIRTDVFQKSTPEEVERFERFLNNNAPFDCVVDGLNVMYSAGTKKSSAFYANLLSSVIKYFSNRNKKVLVLARKHILAWPKSQMAFIQQNSKLFLTDNITHDDPFLLYATLKSGQKTDFVSRDLMRSHAFLLGPELRDIFRRWQQEHQYCFVAPKTSGDLILQEPIRFNLTAHKRNNKWHIPFRKFDSPQTQEVLTVPSSWLCIS